LKLISEDYIPEIGFRSAATPDWEEGKLTLMTGGTHALTHSKFEIVYVGMEGGPDPLTRPHTRRSYFLLN